ncbi:hypothetical protein F5882DRAFT_378493 [Hyaloscypha sp. PMI_1271]|nr:hypothetical protein F5882DRAFT_378493 [Hyaloscypha sp. PMI_1271]
MVTGVCLNSAANITAILEAYNGQGRLDEDPFLTPARRTPAMHLIYASQSLNSGRYSNALQAASSEGHEFVVWFLLENGAGVDSQGNGCGNAFQAASHKDRVEIVCDLLSQEGNFDD